MAILSHLHLYVSLVEEQQRVRCADIMRSWRQTAVRQATNEELIGSFLLGLCVCVWPFRGRGRRWRWRLVLGGGRWCYREVFAVTQRGPRMVIKCKRWWGLLSTYKRVGQRRENNELNEDLYVWPHTWYMNVFAGSINLYSIKINE